MKIGRIQVLSRRTTIDGQPFIDRTMRHRIHIRDDGHNWVPLERRDCAVLAGKDKPRRSGSADTVVYYKASAAIEDETSRISLRGAHSWNRKERGGSGTDVVERCFAGPVVGDPP